MIIELQGFSLEQGACGFMSPESTTSDFMLKVLSPLPFIPPRVGAVFCDEKATPMFQTLANGRMPGPRNDQHTTSINGTWVRGLTTVNTLSGSLRLAGTRQGMTLARVTLSDKGFRGERKDEAGPLIQEMVHEALGLALCTPFLIPDEEQGLRALLTDLALVQGFDLIVTTGGTGLAPTDHTPEATLAAIDKRLPGMEQAMMAESLAKTPHAGLSRAVVGTLGQSMIVNLPGSPKAVKENLSAVLPALKHGLAKLQGDTADCAQA